MTGAQLARAIAQLCSSKPELDAKLVTVLAKWVKDNIAKGATLDTLRNMANCGGTDVLRWHVGTLTDAEITALIKKLDPHRPKSPTDSQSTLKRHVLDLLSGAIGPSEKAEKPKPKPIPEILAMRDPVTRRIELDRHSSAQLKKAVRENSIDAEQLGSKPSKTEIIEHIQAAISAGWPTERSILDINKH